MRAAEYRFRAVCRMPCKLWSRSAVRAEVSGKMESGVLGLDMYDVRRALEKTGLRYAD